MLRISFLPISTVPIHEQLARETDEDSATRITVERTATAIQRWEGEGGVWHCCQATPLWHLVRFLALLSVADCRVSFRGVPHE